MPYKGTIEVISGLKQANNQDFALAKTHDIWADEPDKRLDQVIEDIIGGDSGSLRTKADKANTVLDTYLSRGRLDGSQIGTNSFAFGRDVEASGPYSHAEGGWTKATKSYTHAEGIESTASEDFAHAEGQHTTASGCDAHAEGYLTVAQGDHSHAEGARTNAYGQYSHSEGMLSTTGDRNNTEVGESAHAEGNRTNATANYAHSEGDRSTASGTAAHAEGTSTTAQGNNSHAEGTATTAEGNNSHAEGNSTIAEGAAAHAEGGVYSEQSGSEVEEFITSAGGAASHAEGEGTTATGEASHTEGIKTTTNGVASHAEGKETETTAAANYSHVEGLGTKAAKEAQHVEGKYNVQSNSHLHIVGNGTSSSRSNAYALDSSGNGRYKGDVYVNCANDSSGGKKLATEESVNTADALKADKRDTVLTTTLSRGRNATPATGIGSFAFGEDLTAMGSYSHAEGSGTYAYGPYSHVEGYGSVAGNVDGSGQSTHAEGESSRAHANYSHAEGYSVYVDGVAGHGEGYDTSVYGDYAHSEGYKTIAEADSSHVSGEYNVSDSYANWPEYQVGTFYDVGAKVKRVLYTLSGNVTVGYICKTAHANYVDFTEANWIEWGKKMNYVEIVGNGTSSARSNARALDWDGNEYLKGNVYVNCAANSTNGNKVATEMYVDSVGEYKANKADTVLDTHLSHGRKDETDKGAGSIAFGNNVTASKSNSQAFGDATTASASAAHAEGYESTASGIASHAEGWTSTASGIASHAEGLRTTASNRASHAEGADTTASGTNSHAEGNATTASGNDSHAEGTGTITGADNQHVEGMYNVVKRSFLHIVGNGTADNARSNAFALSDTGTGYYNGDLYVNCSADSTGGNKVATEGYVTAAISAGIIEKADKADTVLETTLSRGRSNIGSTGTGSFAFGNNVAAQGDYSHAEGSGTLANGKYSHAEGYSTDAGASGNAQYPGEGAHAEGRSSHAYGNYSHAEGYGTSANVHAAHAEGMGTTAEAENSHVSGMYNVADSYNNWPAFALDTSYEVGDKVKVMEYTIAGNFFVGYICKTAHVSSVQFDSSKWNAWGQKMNYAEIIGNGKSSSEKSNARALGWDGSEYLAGDLYVNCDRTSLNGQKVATEGYVSTSYAPLVSPALTGTPTAPTAASGTKTTQIATTEFVMNAFSANDAMVFKGTLGSSGTVTSLPATHQVGWSYKVVNAGTYAGQKCEIGDLVICVGTAGTNADWAVVQSNIDGAVIGPASATTGHVAVFNDGSGKVIKDSGYTIQTSVPPSAVFTDTKVTSTANHYTPQTSAGSEYTASASGGTAAWGVDVVQGVTLSTDGKGHITGIEVTSGKLPNSPSTTKVRQTLNTENVNRPLLLSYSDNTVATSNIDNVTYRNNSIYANPSTGTIIAPNISTTTISCGRAENSTVGANSIAFGDSVEASGAQSQAMGNHATASANYAHAEGANTTASKTGAHAEGEHTNAFGYYSHAEGMYTNANDSAHAEGQGTYANGVASHAEGMYTIAAAESSHVGGVYNVEDSYASWPEFSSNTYYPVGAKMKYTQHTSGGMVSTGYICKIAHTSGNSIATPYWTEWGDFGQKMNFAEIIGNGTDASHKSNARALGWDGNEYLAGDVYVKCDSSSANGKKLATEEYVNTHSSGEAITNAQIDALFD